MKVSAALTLALAGVSIGSPVGLEERDLEPRVLNLVPALSPNLATVLPFPIPAIPNIGVPPAPGIPPIPVSPADIQSAITSLFQSIRVVIANLLQGLPGNTLPIPTFPEIPGLLPVNPTLPVGSLTPQQLLALTTALQNQLGNLTALGNNLPISTILFGGLNAAQLTAVRDALTTAQTQLNPILSSPTGVLATLGNLQGALPGGPTNLPQLQSLLAGFATVLILVNGFLTTVTGLLGPILGGGGGLPILGGGGGLPALPTLPGLPI